MGANSQQAYDVVTTSMRRNDVTSTSFRRHVPTRFLINQCHIITFLILKYDIIENSRAPLNQIKITLLLFYPSTWYICDFLLFHIEIKRKDRWIIGGQRVCCPPLKLLGGGAGPPAPPPPPPSSYAYDVGCGCGESVECDISFIPHLKDLSLAIWSSEFG